MLYASQSIVMDGGPYHYPPRHLPHPAAAWSPEPLGLPYYGPPRGPQSPAMDFRKDALNSQPGVLVGQYGAGQNNSDYNLRNDEYLTEEKGGYIASKSSGPTKGSRRKRKMETNEPRLCMVCGGEAGKHSYYGGQCCPSCRAFFRRAVNSGYMNTYSCEKEGDCSINQKTRKNCQFCRFQKCKTAGMRVGWVLSEEEIKQKEKVKKENRKNREKDLDSDYPGSPTNAIEDKRRPMEEDLYKIEEYLAASDFKQTSKIDDMDKELVREIIRMVAFKAPLTEVGFARLRSLMATRIKSFALKLREFQGLSERDRKEILSKNTPLLVKLRMATLFNPEVAWRKQLTWLLGSVEVDKLYNKLKSLCDEELDHVSLEYSQFFVTPFLQDNESEDDFIKLLLKMGSWPEDEREHILMNLLMLFSTDQLMLENLEKVDAIQLNIAKLLHSFLIHSYGRVRGRSKFAKAILLVTNSRQLQNTLQNINTSSLDY